MLRQNAFGEWESDIPWIQDNIVSPFQSFFGKSSQGSEPQYDENSIYFKPGDKNIKELADKLGIGVMTDATKEYLLNYMLNEQSSEAAWNRSVFAAKNQYQWLTEDLQKAGLNPFLALSGLNAAQASSSGQGVGSGMITSRKNNELTNQTNMMRALMTAIASIIGIALFKK